MTDDPLAQLRDICLALPEATEKLSFGEHPTFRVRDRIFVMYMVDAQGPSLWCKAPPGDQEILVGVDPERYFVPPYVGHHGWLGIRLSDDVDWDLLGDTVETSYRMTAPKRLLARLPGR